MVVCMPARLPTTPPSAPHAPPPGQATHAPAVPSTRGRRAVHRCPGLLLRLCGTRSGLGVHTHTHGHASSSARRWRCCRCCCSLVGPCLCIEIKTERQTKRNVSTLRTRCMWNKARDAGRPWAFPRRIARQRRRRAVIIPSAATATRDRYVASVLAARAGGKTRQRMHSGARSPTILLSITNNKTAKGEPLRRDAECRLRGPCVHEVSASGAESSSARDDEILVCALPFGTSPMES